MSHPLRPLALTLALIPLASQAESDRLEEMVVTGVRMSVPLRLDTNPKAARQPLPAHDGADYLKHLPGFSVIRKGGTDGDPVFRGMAGSRLNILQDGEMVLGGCSSRMDPPTAYVFPEAYDRITVIKGPQTVLHGPGNAAGTVLFEREYSRRENTGWSGAASVLGGSFGRHDEVVDISGGTPELQLRGTATNARQGDYRDGNGDKVHSAYHRWSSSLSAAWTPDDDTTLILSGGHSDGEAAYADRSVDGSRFARDHVSLRLLQDSPWEGWTSLEALLFYNYVDHVMDNYSLRTPPAMGMMSARSAMNPDRETIGGRIAATRSLSGKDTLVVGLDTQSNQHSNRMSMNQDMQRYQSITRDDDARFLQAGLFAELQQALDTDRTLVAGVRADYWKAEDKRERIALGMMSSLPNPGAGDTRHDTLASAFVRLEQTIATGTAYIGLGRSERFPDYWELIAREGAEGLSAFDVSPETLHQLDSGLVFQTGDLRGSLSLFYNQVDDYLLVQSNVARPMGMMTRLTSIIRNVDTHSWGGEVDLAYTLAPHWALQATLSYVRANNDTDDSPLAQTPPLEGRFGITYDNQRWSVGALVRAVDAQHRIALDQGNIAGQDQGDTRGFATLSLNAGWRVANGVLLTAGVDNVFDRTYAEHLSRAGAMVSGFIQTDRVNEPGRNLWVKAQFEF